MALTNKIGVIVDSFRVGVREGLRKAKEVGADGVQIYAVKGEMDPDRLSLADRHNLKTYIQSLGLEISALCGDMGAPGFQDSAANPERIAKSKRILELAVQLGTNVVTTHIGRVPEDPNDPIYSEMQRACEELAAYANKLDAYFAIETGKETAAQLKRFLDSLSTKGVAVNFDPANMVMGTGDDPVEGIKLLQNYIVHTHVKDGIRLAEPLPNGRRSKEVPLGEGDVLFARYFPMIEQIGYTGYLTIERETGDQPEADIQKAVQFIKNYKR